MTVSGEVTSGACVCLNDRNEVTLPDAEIEHKRRPGR